MMKNYKKLVNTFTLMIFVLTVGTITMSNSPVKSVDKSNVADNFYKSDKLLIQKVTFKNQFGLKVTGNLYRPKNAVTNTELSAIVVGHPMGAVKEQSSNLYAQKMAERGFVTLAIDLSYWGESEGTPRNAVAPEMYVEDFSAGVDYLGAQSFVDKENIGVLGICGSGSFAIGAAKIDSRIKAVATVSMYNMGGAFRDGIEKYPTTLEQRKELVKAASQQRDVEFNGGNPVYIGGTTLELTDDTDEIQREFYDFYRTSRGEYTPEGASSKTTTKPSLSTATKFMNFYPFNDMEMIAPRPMLFITGENAHSRSFSEEAYRRYNSDAKDLHIVKGAGHVDLYDRTKLIPWDKLVDFFQTNLK